MNLERSGRLRGQALPYAPIRNRERDRIRGYLTLAVADLVVITACFLLANLISLGDGLASHGLTMLTVLLPIYCWIGAIGGAYSGAVLSDWRPSAWGAIRALAFAASSLLIIAYSFKVGADFSRLVFWIGALSSIAALAVERTVLSRFLLRRLGGNPLSTVLIDDIGNCEGRPGDMVLDAKQIGFHPRTDDPLHFDLLAQIVGPADRVLVACAEERVVAWAHVLKCMAVNGEVIVPGVDHVGLIGIGRYEERRTFIVAAGPLHLRDRVVKRLFDLAVSILALALFSPLLICLAIAIRLESAGPVLFKQQRIGRDNLLFSMLKFRSMYQEDCDVTARRLTERSDVRVTKVGAWLRRNSLDELPQLLNVLRGEMSVVGPRPHALSATAGDQLYWEIDARYRYRHAVKPGMTGLAQIRGYRGATVSTADLTNRLTSDLEYLAHWSLWRDVWILFRTLSVIRHDNAF